MSKLNKIWRPWFLAVVVALGFAIAWGAVVGFGLVLLEQTLRSKYPLKSVEVLADGTLAIMTYWRNDQRPSAWETLDGKPVPKPDRERVSSFAVAHLPGPLRPGRGADQLSWDRRTMYFVDLSGTMPILWYLVHDGERDGSACFEGYDWTTKLLVGYIGKKGFQLQKPAAEDRFSIPSQRFNNHRGAVLDIGGQAYSSRSPDGKVTGNSVPSGTVFLLAGNQLLTVDLQQRTVKVVRRIVRHGVDDFIVVVHLLGREHNTDERVPISRCGSFHSVRNSRPLWNIPGAANQKEYSATGS